MSTNSLRSVPDAVHSDALARAQLRVSRITDLDEAEAVWRDLLARSPSSVYQSPDFLLPWLRIAGASEGVHPLILGFYAGREAIAVLPLGVSRVGPLRIAEFLGGKHANFNLPIFAEPFAALDTETLRQGLADGARLAGVDLYSLRNQPEIWDGVMNPLLRLSGQASPSFGYELALGPDAETILKGRLSSDARKNLRRKQGKLERLGTVAFVEARTPDERRAMLECYFAQKADRFKAQGITDHFADPCVQAWFRQQIEPAAATGEPVLRLYGLSLDGRYVSIWGIGVHGRHASGMITSFVNEAEIAKTAPGELLLAWLVAKLCRDGCDRFDFGVGEARYKQIWCDGTIGLFDTHLAVSSLGRLAQHAFHFRGVAKRRIKQSPFLMDALKRLRRNKTGARDTAG